MIYRVLNLSEKQPKGATAFSSEILAPEDPSPRGIWLSLSNDEILIITKEAIEAAYYLLQSFENLELK